MKKSFKEGEREREKIRKKKSHHKHTSFIWYTYPYTYKYTVSILQDFHYLERPSFSHLDRRLLWLIFSESCRQHELTP